MIPLSDAAVARLFLGVIGIGFVVLTIWGFQIRAAAIRLEREHPDYFETLRRRSRRRLPRLAVVSELQTALFGKERMPEEVAADPVFARFLRRERALRNLFVPLALVAFLIYAVA